MIDMATEKEIRAIKKRISNFNQKDNHIKIYEKNVFDFKDKIIYGINWGAIGTQSVKNTEKFVKELQKGIEIAKKSSNKFSEQDLMKIFRE